MKKPKAMSAVERQKKWLKKRFDAGWKRRCVMVPPHAVAEFDKMVERLKKKWNK